MSKRHSIKLILDASEIVELPFGDLVNVPYLFSFIFNACSYTSLI